MTEKVCITLTPEPETVELGHLVSCTPNLESYGMKSVLLPFNLSFHENQLVSEIV